MFLILEQIYMELYEMFSFADFHLGGSDFNFNCWNSSSAVTSYMQQRDYLADLDEEGAQGHDFVTLELSKPTEKQLRKNSFSFVYIFQRNCSKLMDHLVH